MELVEVDPVGAEAPEAVLDGDADPFARAPTPSPTGRMPEFGRDDHVLATPLERSAKHLLALSASVDVGGVEKGDPLLERSVDHTRRAFSIHAAAEIVATESDHRGLKDPSVNGTRLEAAHVGQSTQSRCLNRNRRLVG